MTSRFAGARRGWAVVVVGVLAGAAALSLDVASAAPDRGGAAKREVVLVANTEGMIDLGLAPYIERVIRTASEIGAVTVIVEVNTFGGRVDAAVAIRDHLLRSPVPTVAFVNKRAISAGALIALSAQKVVMASGATIGAATPVQMGQPGEAAAPVSEKMVSYVRKEFRATADARGRPGLIAEAMVDADVEIPELVARGKLLTLTTAEALRHGVADLEADDLTSALAQLGLAEAEVRRVDENWAERVVRFLTHPIVSSLLITLAMMGILIELRTPGLGLPGLVGALSLVAFFWGHALVELVGWEEVGLVIAGFILLALEVFVLPGFGIAGVLGGLALLAGLTMSLLGTGASFQMMVYALARIAISGAVAVLASLAALHFLPRLPVGRRLILGATLRGGERAGDESSARPLVGIVGTALTPLRPAGIAELDGRRVDVVSDGEFIDAGMAVEVVVEAGNRVVVTPHRTPPSEGQS
jgi:membrane-bound serine protease (ClpP class)